MAGNNKRKKKCPPEGAADWMLTYGDMVTLLLTFFVMMYTTAEVDGSELRLVIAAFQGLGVLEGGNTLESGKLVELGNNLMTLPSMTAGRALAMARKKAVSEFQPEIKSNKVRITMDERGLTISLAADSYFDPGSAEIDIEKARDMLQKVAGLIQSLPGKKIRIEGHTDNIPVDLNSPYPTNWELSAARAANILHRLVEYGSLENSFQIMGLADTVPLHRNDTEEGRAYNRRVDIVVLAEGLY